MKKVLIGFSIIILLIIAGVIAFPIIFKDEIKREFEIAVTEDIDAKVEFLDFDLTLIKNFPNLTISLKGLTIINNAPFEGEEFISCKEINLTLDILSVLGDEKIQIIGFLLDQPNINVLTRKDGVSNYEFLLASNEDESNDKEDIAFDIGIQKWRIQKGKIVLSDKVNSIDFNINELNHSGNGDFNQDIFDLYTNTEFKGLGFYYDGIDYLDSATFHSDITLNIDNSNSKYTFKENEFKLNDFGFNVDGWLTMNEAMEFDIKYGVKETEFSHLLSLVPGIFMDGFDKIKTEGNFKFDGFIKGIYNDSLNKMPAFDLDLQVADALFQYPDLPSAIENIGLELKIHSKQDGMENMEVLLNKLHLDMGTNPLDAKALIVLNNSLESYKIDADIDSKVKLEEITKFYPLDGMKLKGFLDVDAKITGIYDSIHMPSTNALLNLKDGFVQSKQLPSALKDVNFDMNIVNKSGELSSTIIDLKKFNMMLDDEPVSIRAYIENLESAIFDVDVNGVIDFEKVAKILELKEMTLKGKMIADVKTSGNMKDVEAENYTAIPTSGSMKFSNFYYSDKDLPNGFKMDDALFTFTPKEIIIESLSGMLGKSDINVNGNLSNYMNFIFKENETIIGNMNFTSNKFDVNEWMEEESTDGSSDEESLEVVELPKNVDFTLKSSISKVIYDNMELDNMTGDVVLKNGIAYLEGVKFNTIGGDFGIEGSYDPTDLSHPKFDLDLDVQRASISKAYQTFNTFQKLAPIAEKMDGLFSTTFNLDGELDQQMMPNLNTVSGKGLVNVLDAVANTNIGFLDEISKITNQKNLGSKSNSFSSMLLDAEIKEGRLHLAPFDVKLPNGKTMNVSGSNGVDGTLDYIMSMKVPTGELGSNLTNQISGLPGGNFLTLDEVDLNMNMLGTHENPVIKLLGIGNGGKSIKDNVKENLTNTLDDKKGEAEAKAKAELEKKKAEQRKRIIDQAQTQANNIKKQGKIAADKVRKSGYAAADKLVKDAGSNPIKKRLAQEAAKKAKTETDKKAKRIETEANAKADKLVKEAKIKAGRI